MYIRGKPNTLKNGTKRISYGLHITKRVNGLPRAKTILNLGMDFSVPKKDWDHVCRQVTARLTKQSTILDHDDPYKDVVKDIVKELLEKGFDITKPMDERITVTPYKIRFKDVRSVGGERVALQALEHLGFDAFLKSKGMSLRYRKIAAMLVVGRMLKPSSERKLHDWIEKESSISELLHMETDKPCLSSLYRVGEALYGYNKELMDNLFGKAKDFFGFKPMVALYDLTNTYYTGSSKDSELLARGKSKEKRKDCPLVSLAMTIDGSGFPLRAKIYPGNISEPKTLGDAVASLGGLKPLVVMDAGLSTKDNLALLKDRGLGWITVVRGHKESVPDRVPDATIETQSGSLLKAWELEEKDGDRRIQVYSPGRKLKEDAILEKFRKDYEGALLDLEAGLSKPRCLKHYDRVLKRVGKLEERYKLVSGQYQVKVKKKRGSNLASAISFSRLALYDKHTTGAGTKILRTSQKAWSIEQVVRQYHQLNDIEQTFRSLKSNLGLRPIFHQKDIRIEAHIFISILAYYAVHLIRTQLKKEGIHSDWNTLKDVLNTWKRGSVRLYQNKDIQHTYRMDEDIEGVPCEIASILKLPLEDNFIKKLKE